METKYLLDTNVLISMFRNKGMVRSHIKEVGFRNCVVSEISLAELFYGAAKGGRLENFKDIDNVLKRFEVYLSSHIWNNMEKSKHSLKIKVSVLMTLIF